MAALLHPPSWLKVAVVRSTAVEMLSPLEVDLRQSSKLVWMSSFCRGCPVVQRADAGLYHPPCHVSRYLMRQRHHDHFWITCHLGGNLTNLLQDVKIWVKPINGTAEVTELNHLPFPAARGHVVTKAILLSACITFPELSF